MTLEDLRTSLTEVDNQLVELVARRQHIVEKISNHKLETGTATRDYQREKRVIEGVRKRATTLGLRPELAEEIMSLLIESSLSRQEKARVEAEGSGGGQRAIVIGGSGQMGNWFADFLASQGYVVSISDPMANDSSRFDVVGEWAAHVDEFELIVVAAPLGATAKILEQLAQLRPAALIIEIGSLKSPLRNGLQQLEEARCRVASIHPMFGPDTLLLSGKHVIFVGTESSPSYEAVQKLFSSTMAEHIVMDLDEHDRLIAYILGLSHALNLTFSKVLAGSGELVPRLAQISSTTFKAQLDVADLVVRENPHLYFEIQALNKFGGQALDALVEATEDVRRLVIASDEAGFVELMETGRQYMTRRG